MNKKILIGIILLIIITVLIIAVRPNSEPESKEEISQQETQSEDIQNIQNTVSNSEPTKTVAEIKSETGSTASEEIYEVQKEYDGREVLAIKPNIQFKTVLAGILKKGQPTEKDIEKLDLSTYHKGIWISEVSRDKFLNILKKCGIENFEIDDNGYLQQKEESQNEYSEKLRDLINSDELTIIDITGTCYIRDEMTGDIVEYPFKDMDLYQICEIYETEGSKIIVITTNDVEEIDILEKICNLS